MNSSMLKFGLKASLATFALLSVSMFANPVSAESSPQKPNIIVILADDMGLDSVSAFNDKLGLETPEIDRLASQGVSFTDAHSTSAVCTPTRYGLLTGRYNWRSRLKRGIVGPWERPLIEDGRLTLGGMLGGHGYHSACIGKWHLGWHWPKRGGGTTEKLAQIDFTQPIGGGPNSFGFEYYFGDDVPNWPPYAWRENERLIGEITTRMKGGAMVGVSAGPAVADWDFRAVLSEYAKRCSQHIHQRAKQEQPYFLFIPMPSPHTPIAPHADFRGRTGVSEYADFLVQTDWAVGEILKAVKESGKEDDTVVFFTCDNGTSPKANFKELDAKGIHLNEHWRGCKADAYEGGHRVPFIARWPGHFEAGAVSGQTITTADIMATCAEIVEHELPDSAAEDSVSLLPVLRGESVDGPLHEVVIHHSVSGHFAVRKGKWKLLLCRGSGGWSSPKEAEATKKGLPPVQLFDLDVDAKETTNLHAEHPEIVKELKSELRRVVEEGRSTPGAKQPNHNGQTWWKGFLPWDRS